MTVFIIFLCLFPFYAVNINIPTYNVGGVIVDLRYILSGVIFIIASISDLIDGVFKDDEIKEKIYNELFSAGVYIDEDGEIDLAQGVEHIRKVLFTNEKEDQKVSEVLSDCTIDDLKKLGILYLIKILFHYH